MRLFEFDNTYIFEDVQKTIAVYPGRFHPFHKGHKAVYDHLSKKYDEVFIATSDKQEEGSPFSFEEKKKMMLLTGIPENNISLEREPYRPLNIQSNFDENTTALVMGLGQKDMEGENVRFKPGVKKNGEPSYFQYNTDNKEPFSKHAYLEVVPTVTFDVLGQKAKSATEMRKMYSSLNDDQAQQFIQDLFGNYDSEVQQILDTKLNRR